MYCTLNSWSIGALTALVAWCAGEFSVTSHAQTAPAGDELVRLEYLDNELICARVKIFDENTLFVIDASSPGTMVDRRFQSQLGKRLEKSSVGPKAAGTGDVPYFSSPPMTMMNGDSGLELAVSSVGVVDLKRLRESSGQPISGVIGMDFLTKYVLRLNFDEQYFALGRDPRDTSGQVKGFDFRGPDTIVPSVELRVSDVSVGEFVFDTGRINVGIELDVKRFQQAKQRQRLVANEELMSVAFDGSMTLPTGILDQFELREISLGNVDVVSTDRNRVGLQFLERFESEFDFRRHKAYFRPGKCLNRVPRFNLAQFEVKVVDSKFEVAGCGDVAQQAGIRVGDILIEVNNRPAGELTIGEFRRLQRLPESDLTLQFERDGQTFDATLQLKQPPNPFSVPAATTAEFPEM